MQKNYPELKKKLEKQHYGIVGNHSAVKICGWTNKSLRDKGICYKDQFYGIRTHLCCQMTPSVGFCQNNCVYCWREVDYSIKNQFDVVDSPEEIYEQCVQEQRRLLTGYKGTDNTNLKKWDEAQDPEHFAISLSGEPTMYPKLNELIRLLHSKGKTTFLVSNGMLPDVIEKLELPTQLYISIDAPNKEMFEEICKPLHLDAWERLMKTLDIIKPMKEKARTTLRITAIKEKNMVDPKGWAELIEKAQPMFVEVKAYMFVGSSRQRMTIANMPYHENVVEFSKQIAEYCSYKIIDEKKESRVVLLMQEDRDDRIMKFD